ncbi:hypothetical protein D9M69_635710 [compost metagenome]
MSYNGASSTVTSLFSAPTKVPGMRSHGWPLARSGATALETTQAPLVWRQRVTVYLPSFTSSTRYCSTSLKPKPSRSFRHSRMTTSERMCSAPTCWTSQLITSLAS